MWTTVRLLGLLMVGAGGAWLVLLGMHQFTTPDPWINGILIGLGLLVLASGVQLIRTGGPQ